MKENLKFKTKESNEIKIDFYSEPDIRNGDLIILVHGFKGFKDWGFFPYTAEYLSKKGLDVLTFNFSHNGVGQSFTEFDELDKFEKNTISLEVSELNQIIIACYQSMLLKEKPRRIGLLGHSRGAGISILSALKTNMVNALCCWAPISKFDRYTERQKIEWRKNGFFDVLNTRTNQMMRMSVDLLNDIELNKDDKLNIEKAVKRLEIPFLLVHGEQDLTVPIKESELIYEWSNKKLTIFEKIDQVGHTFDIVHPFSGTNKKFDKILKLTAEFFLNSLNF